MTVSSTISKQSYAGDGTTGSFPIPFLFLANDHIEAVLRDGAGNETVWLENTHYTLSGAGAQDGGTLTVSTTPADHTPQPGETLTIRRVVPATQETDYPEGGAFPAAAHETALDKLTMLVQQHAEQFARALLFPVSDSAGLSGEIPSSAARAGRVLGFDSSGRPIAVAGTSGEVPISSVMEPVVGAASLAAARAEMGLAIGINVLAPGGDGSQLSGIEAFAAGMVLPYVGVAAPAGWLLLNGDTIGDAGSGAMREDAANEVLFTLLWDSMADTEAPVSGGRGSSAAADWAAGKTITLPDARGRTVIGAGQGAGLTMRTHGDKGGAETHQLTVDEMPGHVHTGQFAQGSGYPSDGGSAVTQALQTGSGVTNSTGGDQAHNNMQPWLSLSFIVKI